MATSKAGWKSLIRSCKTVSQRASRTRTLIPMVLWGYSSGLIIQVLPSQLIFTTTSLSRENLQKDLCERESTVDEFDAMWKVVLTCDEAHFWLNGYVNKQNCRIWSEANPQVYVETPLHPEKLTVWCALWAGGILLQKR
ncbi:hypothetical protein TNCV_153601 [Trichonephila clavipes]|nr:hypothetical protein TNCV_153601 [Trichonephila clavipes]